MAIAVVMIFFTSLSLYLFLAEFVSFPPLYWMIGFGVAAAPVCLSLRSVLTVRHSMLARWCYGFLMISSLWLMFQPSPSEIVWQEFQTRVLSVLFVLALICIFSSEGAQLWARRATLAAVLVAVGFNLYELFNPLSFSTVMGRSAGLYMNPNQCAVALILGMVISLGLLPHRYRVLFASLVGLGVLLTLSRSAAIGWFITILALIKTGQISLRRSILIGCTLVTVTLAAAVWQWNKIEYQLEDLGVLNPNTTMRLDWFNNMDASDFSATERKQVAEFGWEMFSDSPIVGHGVGASIDWSYERSSHNEYLNMMVDHGIVGFFILPLLALATTWRGRGEARQIGFAFTAFILYFGFFSHNILNERPVLMTFALLSSMVMSSREGQAREERSQNESRTYYHCFAR
ncbi:MAG TPA: O-antigen ligase family protein [Blastocatellia bacterium]|jgi:O-antigen ligase